VVVSWLMLSCCKQSVCGHYHLIRNSEHLNSRRVCCVEAAGSSCLCKLLDWGSATHLLGGHTQLTSLGCSSSMYSAQLTACLRDLARHFKTDPSETVGGSVLDTRTNWYCVNWLDEEGSSHLRWCYFHVMMLWKKGGLLHNFAYCCTHPIVMRQCCKFCCCILTCV
jgi:hypothetical protein